MRQFSGNSAALAAFIARKTEIDTILARLAALSAEHFNWLPDDVSWADVGTLGGFPGRSARSQRCRFPRGRIRSLKRTQ